MDPELIERVAPHPQSEQLYTVISKPLKAEHRRESPTVGKVSQPAVGEKEGSPPLRLVPPTKPPPPTKVLNKLAQPSGKPARPLLPPSRASKLSNPPPSCKPPPPPTSSSPPPTSKPPPPPKGNSPSPTSKPPPPPKSGAGLDDPDYADIDEEEVEEDVKHEHIRQIKPGQPDRQDKVFLVKRPQRRSGKQPSYDEVTPNLPIVVEPVPPRQSAGATDDLWGKFKFQTMPSVRSESISRRSSSSSNLTTGSSSEYYSNLADLQIGSAFVGETQRRHSFSGEEKIVIKGTANRESIIPVNAVGLDEPEYRNIGLGGFGGSDDALYKNHPLSGAEGRHPRARVGRIKYVNTHIVNGRGSRDDSELVYENQDPEGRFHIYTNESDLLEQVRTA